MGKEDELIVVVSREALFNSGGMEFQGFVSGQALVNTLLQHVDLNMTTMRRGDAEKDPTFKQPIPYVVIKRGDEVFAYRRLLGGGEERLHGKLSLGVGGHMNPVPEAKTFALALVSNMERELSEELDFDKTGAKWWIAGFINDDTDEVGRVHIGILVVYEVTSRNVRVRETDSLEGNWMKLADLKASGRYDRLENWSKITVDALSAH